MGNDGGSIPRRIELVKEKQKNVKLNPDLERVAAWFHCALSKQPLVPPVASCGLGKLYNQEAIIEYILDPKAYGDGDKICSHIQSQKDICKLNLTTNPDYNESKVNSDATTMGNLDKDVKCRFICPITMKEMNGNNRFVYLDTCGCAFAEQVSKEIQDMQCLSCGKPFEKKNIILINPDKETLKRMTADLEEKKARLKAEKKAKKAAKIANGETSATKKRKRDISLKTADLDHDKRPHLSSSTATAVMGKVAQELAEKEKKKEMSKALKSIYAKKDVKGNYLTMGTFTRYA